MSDIQYIAFKDKKGKIISVAQTQDGEDENSVIKISISVPNMDKAEKISKQKFKDLLLTLGKL